MRTFLFSQTSRKEFLQNNLYVLLVFFHILLGAIVYWLPVISKIYAILIIMVGLFFVIKNKNRNHEVLYVIAYLTGCEIFLRTTHGCPNYEFAKYSMFVFVLLGIFYKGISRKATPYLIYLILLIPGILLTLMTSQTGIRKRIFFEVAGPVCLGIGALYTYGKKITVAEIHTILLSVGLPVLSSCSFLLFKCPLTNFIIGSTESNFMLSGDFAPNQMATTLGLGLFVFFSRLILIPSSRKIIVLNIIITAYIYYRCLLTLSRGGTITGVAIVLVLVGCVWMNAKEYQNLKQKFTISLVAFVSVFMLTSYQMDGILIKRYLNQNPSGLRKSEDKNGREELALEEIKFFRENPLVGIGAGNSRQIRHTEWGLTVNSHSEMTRILAEHGSFGMISILILITVPLLLFLKNRRNIYLLCFFAFWILTINHSGMRLAAPAFIYALALLDIEFKKPETIEIAEG